jgi:hypothetical protein
MLMDLYAHICPYTPIYAHIYPQNLGKFFEKISCATVLFLSRRLHKAVPMHRDSLGYLQGPGSNSCSSNKLADAYEQSAARKGDFFAQKIEENARRAEGVPPSQGGKYVGFGSTPSPAPPDNSAVADLAGMFSSGWNRFALVATAAAAQAQTTVSYTARTLDEQYRSGRLASCVQSGATHALSSAQQLGQTGWGLISSFATNVQSRAGAAMAPESLKFDDWGGHHGVETPADVAAAAKAAAIGRHEGISSARPPQEDLGGGGVCGAGEGGVGRSGSVGSSLVSRARKNESGDKVAGGEGGSKEWDGDW